MLSESEFVHIPDGLARATIFLPVRDVIGVPECKLLFLGEAAFGELAGQLVMSGDTPVPGSEGLTPIWVEFWRIEDSESPDPRLKAAATAYRRSTYCPAALRQTEPPDRTRVDSEHVSTTLVIGVTLLVRSRDGGRDIEGGDILGRALECVGRQQTAYAMVVPGPAVEILTLEQLPPLVPVIFSPGPPAPIAPGNVTLFGTKPFPSSMRFNWPDLLDEAGIHQLVLTTGYITAVHWLPSFQFRNDAQIQLHRYGNYRQSVIASAAAAESFVLPLLELLLWEEGQSPGAAAGIVGARDGILRIVRRELPPRLKGSWNEQRPGPMKSWIDDVLRIRNAIVHGGREATRQEALAALDAVHTLVGFIADRFAEPRVQKLYPKTIIVSVGKMTLEKRQAWSKELEQLRAEHEKDWRAEFLTWRIDLVNELEV